MQSAIAGGLHKRIALVVRWQVQWASQGAVVVGPTGKWLSETIGNMYASKYMMTQTAALFMQPAEEGGHQPKYDTRLISNVWMRKGGG
jgi:hypothetical protein